MIATVTGQDIALDVEELTVSKSVGIYELQFAFDDTWTGWDKTAVYQGSDETIEVVIEDDIAQIPWEVLTKGGWLQIGVYGTQDEKVMPTIWSAGVCVKVGTPPGSIGTEPTPSIYSQILGVANDAKTTAEEAYEKAETAQDSARASAEDAEAWAVGQRAGEDVPSSDETYHNNSKWWAQMAEQSAEESGFAWFDVDENTGEAIVTITDNLDEDVSFEVNYDTGELEVVVA